MLNKVTSGRLAGFGVSVFLTLRQCLPNRSDAMKRWPAVRAEDAMMEYAGESPFEVLATAQELVEVAEVLCPRHDYEQQGDQRKKRAATAGIEARAQISGLLKCHTLLLQCLRKSLCSSALGWIGDAIPVPV